MTLTTMKPFVPAIGLLLCLPVLAAGDRRADPDRGGHHPFSDAAYWAGVWEGAARDEWQKPLDVLRLLSVQPGQVVADLGAGTGYFTRPLSIAVGDEGRVYAVDVEPALLEHIRKRDDIQQDRVVTIRAKPNDPLLPEGAIDLVLIVNTWHHIKSRPAYLERLARCLAPDGRIVLIDFHAGEPPVGPPPKEKISREKALGEFERAGFKLVAESVALPYQYFLTFYPPRDPVTLAIFPTDR